MKVYSCFHRPYPNLAEGIPYIKPIRGGAAITTDLSEFMKETPTGFLRDDFGEGAVDISKRNPMWSELTIHHWIWKNSLDEFVGVCHYRRFFSPFSREELVCKLGVNVRPYLYMPDQEIKDILARDPTGEKFIERFDTVDIILPTPTITQKSMDEMYFDVHPAEHWNTMRKVFQEMYPAEWRSGYRYFEANEVFFRHIMFIGRRSYINAFYDWLFPLLFKLEQELVFPPNEIDHQKRAVSFLAERMFNWWLHSRPVAQAFVPLLFPIDAGADAGVFRQETLKTRHRVSGYEAHLENKNKHREPFTLTAPKNTGIDPSSLRDRIASNYEQYEKNITRFLDAQPRPDVEFDMPTSLDLGCGTEVKNPFRAKVTMGVDVATPDAENNIVYADLNVSRIPFPDNYFDYVTAFDLIEHIPRVLVDNNGQSFYPFINLMNEIHRVLTPTGVFFASTPAYPSSLAFSDPTHVNFISDLTFPLYFCGDGAYAKDFSYGFRGGFDLVAQEWNEGHLMTLMKKAKPPPALELRPARDGFLAFSNDEFSTFFDNAKATFSPMNRFSDKKL